FGLVGGLLGSLLVLIFGFLFVTVSSRLTGEIGSSSNPISGMTVATLLLTCLIFLALNMRSPQDAVLALSIGGVVCTAAEYGGATYRVWRVNAGEFKYYPAAYGAPALGSAVGPAARPALNGKPAEVKPGKYLADDLGRVRYFVDPTITGSLDQRDEYVPAT